MNTYKRLYYCQADIATTRTGQIVLISYNTPVAIIDKKHDFIAIYRYKSATTAQHLRKFQKWLYNNAPFELYQRYRDLLDLAVKKYKADFAIDRCGFTDFFAFNNEYLSKFNSLLTL